MEKLDGFEICFDEYRHISEIMQVHFQTTAIKQVIIFFLLVEVLPSICRKCNICQMQ